MSFREITTVWQYNEPLKRSELLSTHGVGSLKLTTWGVVMPRAIEQWPLLKTVADILNLSPPPLPAAIAITEEQWRAGFLAGQFQSQRIRQVDDPRFVRLLSLPPEEGGKGYTALRHLIEVPQVELNNFNQFKSAALRNSLPPSAVHFPKYFYDPTGNPQLRHLRSYVEAFKQFRLSLGKDESGKAVSVKEARRYFVPPRSARPNASAAASVEKQAAARDLLEPVPVVLMCAHGHVSDIPWARYLKVRSRGSAFPGGTVGLYPRLFDEDECCTNPQLLWQSRGRTTDSFAGVQLSCGSCKASTDLSVLPRIRPTCRGERPWISADNQQPCRNPQPMQYALTTGTNLYFPLGFSGIYLPEKLLASAPLVHPQHLAKLQDRYEGACEDNPGLSPETYWNRSSPKFLASFDIKGLEARKLRAAFLGEPLASPDPADPANERLKREEYELFTGDLRQDEADFKFSNVPLTDVAAGDPPADSTTDADAPRLAGRLALARRVEELRLTRVQLAFTRVQGLDPDQLDEEVRFNLRPQRIHEQPRETVAVLPALTSNGEGIFLELDLGAVARWESRPEVATALRALQPSAASPLSSFQQPLADKLSARLILVHTLAHLLIRELEWKCGYPAASLNERIYVRPARPAATGQPAQPGQAGLLIYATEGSQGSMGGLTFQARPAFLEHLLREALDRALDCPADPICWHADSQAGTPLVRAACFACTMTAETSCELQNTLLDRRLLIDPEYGFFGPWEASPNPSAA